MKHLRVAAIVALSTLAACSPAIERIDPTPVPTPKPTPVATPAYNSPLVDPASRPAPSPPGKSGDWMWQKKSALDEPATSSGGGKGKRKSDR